MAAVLWHWQHFFFNNPAAVNIDRQAQPLYTLLFLFYEKGWFAVDFFFSLSGFVFFWLYADAIRQEKVSTRDFFFLRLSRLYPLHLLTLLLVAGLQWLNMRHNGSYFVYPFNDLYHFFLNIFFASAWGLQKGFSFNAPTWSVSIEVLLYAMFFFIARSLHARATYALIMAIAGFFIYSTSELIGRGMFSFYMGGLVYLAYRQLLAAGIIQSSVKPLATACLCGWILTILAFKMDILQMLCTTTDAASCTGTTASRLEMLWVTGVLLPLTILTLAASEPLHKGGWRRMSWLGDISYASYLLHFPLQLAFFIALSERSADREIFNHPLLWLSYFAVLIGLSLLTHHHLERPLQRWIRQASLRKGSSKVASAPKS